MGVGRPMNGPEVERMAARVRELEQENARLRSAHDLLQHISKATNDAMWDWIPESGEVWWSEGLEVLSGYRPEDLPEGFEAWTQIVHPDDVESVLEGFHAAVEGESNTWEAEYRILHADGSEVWVYDRGQVVRDETGTVRRVVGGMSDVTDRHLLEERESRAELTQTIGTLASGMAHDLNNVLSPILLGVEMLRGEATSPAAREAVDLIERSAASASEMVREVLTLARGAQRERAPIEAATLLLEVAELVNDLLPAGVVLEVGRDGPEAWVSGDRTQLVQVLLNLCLNARDAMPDGGLLRLEVTRGPLSESDPSMVKSQPRVEIPCVRLRVCDTGTGIEEEHFDRLFEPFFTTKGQGRGSGLGLPTSLAIARGHGGFIEASNRPEGGAVLEVVLPAIDPPTSDSDPSSGQEPITVEGASGGGERVLVVEDHQAVAQVVSRTLEAFGYEPVVAATGEEGLAVIRVGEPFGAAFVDLGLPDLDGRDVIEVIRAEQPRTVVIATSGYPDADDGVDADAFLSKPFTTERLLETLRASLAVSTEVVDG